MECPAAYLSFYFLRQDVNMTQSFHLTPLLLRIMHLPHIFIAKATL